MEPTGTTRRLTRILMADVVAYSRLVEQDGEGAARGHLDKAQAYVPGDGPLAKNWDLMLQIFVEP